MQNDKPQFPTAAGVWLGLGLGGFFDGIVLHQILQWHHMLTSAGLPPDSIHNLQVNTLWDGLFHASTYLFVAIGLVLLWRAAHRTHMWWSGRMLTGSILMGFGIFNVVATPRRARFWAAGLLALAAAAPVLSASPASADAAAGAQIASGGTPNGVAACASCHGARGEGGGAFPRLAGTNGDYLRQQLEAFATGSRKNPIMQPIAQSLLPQQRAQVVSYYAALPAAVPVADGEARSRSETGVWLATRGRWDDGVPACAQCHGPGGMGVGASFPPLAGQPASYIAQQLKSWQTGGRPPGPLGLMEGIARKLKDGDIQAVSDYYAGLPAASANGPATSAKKKGAP